MRKIIVSSLALAACLFTAGGAWATADARDHVELSSSRLPAAATALRAACPGLQQQLPDALARVHQRLGHGALVQVSFTLQGAHLSDVVASDGPATYQRAVRWAVRELECQGATATPQRYTLNIRFVDPASASPALASIGAVDVDAGQ
jgi:hypothetical protein